MHVGVSQRQLAELVIAATDVGIYGLLASQSCYHSMLVPCWFTLWTSSRFHSSLHPFDFARNLFIFLFVSILSFKFVMQFEFGEIMYFFVYTISLVCCC